MNLLTAYNLSHGYDREEWLFEKLSLSIAKKDILAIYGENGSGKSTLLRILAREQKPKEGHVESSLKKEDIFLLPQVEGVSFPLPLRFRDFFSKGQEPSLLKAGELNKSWNFASGGERKRLLLALAFRSAAKLILLDEPFNHLDEPSKIKLIDVIRTKNEQEESTFVIVAHGERNLLSKLTTQELEISK